MVMAPHRMKAPAMNAPAIEPPVAELPTVDARAILAALDEVSDPEIPAVSIVELGMITGIDVGPDGIAVQLLPTFVGCPALEIIRDGVSRRLAAFGRPVRVDVSFATPWSSDRISPAGREKLRASGFAPPPSIRPGRGLPMLESTPVACPYCGSNRTTLENLFGPTQCRSIRHCAECRQPFEAFKAI
jgi:ring-1,2-phenylacetyl-CoA epoxidase subunit PaaD